MSRTLGRAVLSVFLGIISIAVIDVVDHFLPYSSVKVNIVDILSMPGYFVGWVFFPGGVHDGRVSAIGWLIAGTCGDVLFYALVWFFAIQFVGRAGPLGQRTH